MPDAQVQSPPHQPEPQVSGAWYKALWVLSAIVALGLITMFLVVKMMPSEVRIVVEKAGATVTIAGGAALFVVLFRVFYRAWGKIAAVIAALVVLVCAPLVYMYDRPEPLSRELNEITYVGPGELLEGQQVFAIGRVDSVMGRDSVSLSVNGSRHLFVASDYARVGHLTAGDTVYVVGTVDGYSHDSLGLEVSATQLEELSRTVFVLPGN